ncbi:unnamed protein product [Linum trigynum]|uniref:RING-type E3 ubiquitin transferase n=1 Tax=Linum trigynum TaxID=586398 RepID=A0AAV2G941_9ROSI
MAAATTTNRRNSPDRKSEQLVAVAVDKDKGSQFALKWAVEHLVNRGDSIVLLHVRPKSSSASSGSALNPWGTPSSISDPKDDGSGKKQSQFDNATKELFLPFRCFCSRKEVKAIEVLVEDADIPKAINTYCIVNGIEVLVLGAPSRGGIIRRFKLTDVPNNVMKMIPDYCTVYVIGKGKIQSIRNATAPPPSRPNFFVDGSRSYRKDYSPLNSMIDDASSLMSSGGGRASSVADMDISFVSGARMSSVDRILFPSYGDNSEFDVSSRLSAVSQSDIISVASSYTASTDFGAFSEFSTSDIDSARLSSASQGMEDAESEVRRLRLELKQTMEMYNNACKEALTAKSKARELQRWKMDKEQKLETAKLAEEAALAAIEEEKAKRKAALEAAEFAQKLVEKEALNRKNFEEKKKTESLPYGDLCCRQYTIEEIQEATNGFSSSLKIGEGGYGPVYRCNLDHTPVAIKALRPDASQGRSQFQQEVDVLSRIRHPNMVLLIGACSENGCLVYEYMANGSLEDRLFRRGNTPALSWQLRFRIAAEIATGLHFLHQTKPEPLVHRDLKPGNILLDRYFVSKISDVGLARLVPPSVANSITQYRMTQTAGTFCYIDPEYQQTGMLGTKSDIYSFGIILLQLITAKPPMGLTHYVQRAIEKGNFADVLDPDVPDWPVEEALAVAKLGIQCAELRRKDRPDLKDVVLPQLSKLRELADEKMESFFFTAAVTAGGGSLVGSPYKTSIQPMSELMSGYESSRSRYSTSSFSSAQ